MDARTAGRTDPREALRCLALFRLRRRVVALRCVALRCVACCCDVVTLTGHSITTQTRRNVVT